MKYNIVSKWRIAMDTKEVKSPKIKKTKSSSVVGGIFIASVLAYCGYKLVNNSLKESKYEPNPYKNVQK